VYNLVSYYQAFKHAKNKRENSTTTTGKTAFCTGSKPSFVPGIELVQTIWYKCGRAFVPGEIPGTNVPSTW
jgi:hypothetical protein